MCVRGGGGGGEWGVGPLPARRRSRAPPRHHRMQETPAEPDRLAGGMGEMLWLFGLWARTDGFAGASLPLNTHSVDSPFPSSTAHKALHSSAMQCQAQQQRPPVGAVERRQPAIGTARCAAPRPQPQPQQSEGLASRRAALGLFSSAALLVGAWPAQAAGGPRGRARLRHFHQRATGRVGAGGCAWAGWRLIFHLLLN